MKYRPTLIEMIIIIVILGIMIALFVGCSGDVARDLRPELEPKKCCPTVTRIKVDTVYINCQHPSNHGHRKDSL